ncbi:ergosterol biosynthetic protein 28 homolog isoform X3 [Manis pentadactyla]|uniref:ergosterol biosynthetic protein 28 homolog isoform X3 n=1 Tax=Manis pentadactyla TaxID=143292 RepID=UPI00255C9674|nr:ergosterol biosynthetic protein 28 homolog isoform X3 [Manis pentadactyla]
MAHVDPGPQLSWGACKPPGLLCFGSGHQISRVVGRKERQKALSGLREVMSRFLNVLRSWLVMVSIIAMGNTLQSFRDHTFLYEKLYTGKPNLVNGLQARTFGIWTLLSSVIRCLCAVDIHNKTLSSRGTEVKREGKAPSQDRLHWSPLASPNTSSQNLQGGGAGMDSAGGGRREFPQADHASS